MINFKNRYPIGRIYIERKEFPSIKIKNSIKYFTPEEGGEHLYNTLKNHWNPDNVVDILITPGGFIKENKKECWKREFKKWDATPDDIRYCVDIAGSNVTKMLISNQILEVAKDKIKYLSIGSDIRFLNKYRAELVFLIDVDAKKIIHWTGKSFPYYESFEENFLIQVTDLCTHFIEVDANFNDDIRKHRVMTLGCHDLTMYHPRGEKTAKGPRKRRRKDFCTIAEYFKPTMIIHHPHVTIHTKTWSDSWNNLTDYNQRKDIVWASGISYYKPKKKSYSCLCDILESTKSCNDKVLDVKLERCVDHTPYYTEVANASNEHA